MVDTDKCFCPDVGRISYHALVIQYLMVEGLETTPRRLISANGSVPGPAISADLGDWIVVDVTNHLDVGTVVHWHGQLQVGTPYADGVPGLSQCLIPPNATLRYGFRASSSGTFWYHGHFNEQYLEGLYGALIVRSPDPPPMAYGAEATLLIMDYYNAPAHDTAVNWFMTPASGGVEPPPNATVVNGVFTGELAIAVNATATPMLLLRFIAANALRMFSVSIDYLVLNIVEIDQTAVEPYAVRV